MHSEGPLRCRRGGVHLKRWVICCSRAARMRNSREHALTLPLHINSQRLRTSSRNSSIHWLSLVHVLGWFSFLVFHERQGYFFLATYTERNVVFWFCFINCGMLLIIFNPTWKLGLGSRGLGIPRGSTDQFVIQVILLKGEKTQKLFFLFLWFLEQYQVVYFLPFGQA